MAAKKQLNNQQIYWKSLAELTKRTLVTFGMSI